MVLHSCRFTLISPPTHKHTQVCLETLGGGQPESNSLNSRLGAGHTHPTPQQLLQEFKHLPHLLLLHTTNYSFHPYQLIFRSTITRRRNKILHMKFMLLYMKSILLYTFFIHVKFKKPSLPLLSRLNPPCPATFPALALQPRHPSQGLQGNHLVKPFSFP